MYVVSFNIQWLYWNLFMGEKNLAADAEHQTQKEKCLF